MWATEMLRTLCTNLIHLFFITGSLSAFVYQHTIMPLALPCKLIIPSQGMFRIFDQDQKNNTLQHEFLQTL